MSPEGAPEKKGGSGKWLAAGCLVVVLVVAACVVALVLWLRGMGAGTAKMALEKVQGHALVVEKLGKPVSMGSRSAAGKINISFPISGPKGEGTVFVEATKSRGEWTLEKLSVQIKGTKETINIVPSTPAPAPKPGGG